MGNYEIIRALKNREKINSQGAGDYIKKIIIIPLALSHGGVTLHDGPMSVSILRGSMATQGNLTPIVLDIGMRSKNDGWRISTGDSVEVIAIIE